MNTVMLELPIDALALPGVPTEELAREAKYMLAQVVLGQQWLEIAEDVVLLMP